MHVLYGADYYPEHWPKERWDTDIRLMKEMGLDVVRLAEFSWSLLETEEGRYNFGWLDDIIERLETVGIKVVLGTPSAAPPAWLVKKDPDILPIDSEGKRSAFGGRHHACQTNKTLRDAISSYVTTFAEKYGNHPNVIGWQIDNELGNSHHDLCHCDSCREAFRDWLEKRYGTIETLNANWGTAFWSQDYNSFDQIDTPKWLVTGHNPSQLLDWRRFRSDVILDFHRIQYDIIRRHSPDRFITQNMMGFADTVNYYELGEQLDFASHDQYPGGFFRGAVENLPALLAAELDMIRGVKQAPFWIMEQQSGITGWQIMGRLPKPGQLALWSMQAIARGADAIVYFRWRVATIGTEQYWHGILPHSGIPGRNYYELKELISKTKGLLSELQGSMPKPRAAMIFSYEQKYAMGIQPNNPDLDYQVHFQKIYNAFYRKQIQLDVIGDHADITEYDLVVAPLQYLMWPALADKYRSYVAGGGTLVLDMRAGVKHQNNINYSEGPLPGLLADLLGISIPEYDPLQKDSVAIQWDDIEGEGRLWADLIEIDADSCRALATYDSDFYSGTPAITVNTYGKGKGVYVGSELDDRLYDRLIEELIANSGLQAVVAGLQDLEITERQNDEKRYLFVLNHDGEAKSISIEDGWQSYFDETNPDQIEAYGYQVYCRDK